VVADLFRLGLIDVLVLFLVPLDGLSRYLRSPPFGFSRFRPFSGHLRFVSSMGFLAAMSRAVTILCLN
jgi:hypothetical protein